MPDPPEFTTRLLAARSGVLVLFSGGQDSATVLAWALEKYNRVETIGFAYGQGHAVEMAVRSELRRAICHHRTVWQTRLGMDHVVQIDLVSQITGCRPGLDQTRESTPDHAAGKSYIVARNLLFLALSANIADRRNLSNLACGVSETEYSGYPDCRASALQATQDAINASSDRQFTIQAPLMQLTKAGVWTLAHNLGGDLLVEIIRTQTHTCYEGERTHLQTWGYGCGKCPACKLRAKGWDEFCSR